MHLLAITFSKLLILEESVICMVHLSRFQQSYTVQL